MTYRSSVLTPFFSLVLIAALILPSLALAQSAVTEEPDWSQPIAINDYQGVGVEREDPHMAVSDSGKLYVVWVDHRNSRSDVYFSYSADRGSSWSANVQVNDDDLGGLYPQIAIDAAGKIYVAYASGSGVYLATSTDDGISWSDATTVAGVTNPANLRLVADTRPGYEGHLNVLWLVWTTHTYTGQTARHIASTDGGKSWFNSTYVLLGPYDSEFVDIRGIDFARRGFSLRAALHNLPVNSDIMGSSSRNNGKNWSVGRLTTAVGVGESEPSLAIDSITCRSMPIIQARPAHRHELPAWHGRMEKAAPSTLRAPKTSWVRRRWQRTRMGATMQPGPRKLFGSSIRRSLF